MYSYSLYTHWSNNFFAFSTRTKEQPHVMSPYSSCTSGQKLYQIQFVTLLICWSASYPVTSHSVIKIRKDKGKSMSTSMSNAGTHSERSEIKALVWMQIIPWLLWLKLQGQAAPGSCVRVVFFKRSIMKMFDWCFLATVTLCFIPAAWHRQDIHMEVALLVRLNDHDGN